MQSFVSVNAKRETKQRRLLLVSSTNGLMVQGAVVHRLVAGSNPGSGAKRGKIKNPGLWRGLPDYSGD